MGRKWVDDQTTLSFIPPEILEQESRIAQQRQLIGQLEASGHPDLADEERGVLRTTCSSLMQLKLDERTAKIDSREESFKPVSEEEAMEQVMRDCPL